jgi:hypothetical protein
MYRFSDAGLDRHAWQSPSCAKNGGVPAQPGVLQAGTTSVLIGATVGEVDGSEDEEGHDQGHGAVRWACGNTLARIDIQTPA